MINCNRNCEHKDEIGICMVRDFPEDECRFENYDDEDEAFSLTKRSAGNHTGRREYAPFL